MANTSGRVGVMARDRGNRRRWILVIPEKRTRGWSRPDRPVRGSGICGPGSLHPGAHLSSFVGNERNDRRRSPQRVGPARCNYVERKTKAVPTALRP